MSSYTQTQASTLLHKAGFEGSASQVVWAFQYGYALGARLTADGASGPKTSAALARTVASGWMISAHFAWAEFRCKCGGRHATCRRYLTDRDLVLGLERYRNLPGVGTVSIVSGHRCPQHNRAVGGASSSQHVRGKAADVQPKLGLNAVEGMGCFNGKGYQRSNGKVVHVDVRETWVRPWQYLS